MSVEISVGHDVKDLSLASEGKKRIEWAQGNMPVLEQIKARFEIEKPFTGVRIAACMHVTTETANLMRTLKSGGAELALAASNPLSTQDDTAAALVQEYGISVFASKGIDRDGYYRNLNQALDIKPNLVFDDGCDLVNTLHTTRTELLEGIMGGCEETTTGVIRLSQMTKDGAIFANSGHFDIEIDVAWLEKNAVTKNKAVRHQTDEYILANGKRLLLIAEGRLVNLGAAEGHPASVMDMSFSDQALTAEWLVKNAAALTAGLHDVPTEIDKEVARLKLESMGATIDTLTPAQELYLNSWEHGS